MRSAWLLKLPERRTDRLVRLLVGGLPDHGGRAVEARERLGERVGPKRPLSVAEVPTLVAVGVADVREVDVERCSGRGRRVGSGERTRERLDVRKAAVGYCVQVREVENRPDPVEAGGDRKDVVERSELVHAPHDL